MRLSVWIVLSVAAVLVAQSAFAEAKLPEGMQLGMYSSDARWVYRYVRGIPEGHKDESAVRDHYLVWTVDSLQPDDGQGGAAITFKEEGGPSDDKTRKVTWRIDAAGCWSMDDAKGKPGTKMCPNAGAGEQSVGLPGDHTLSGLTSLESPTHAALVSPSVGLVLFNSITPEGVVDSWVLEGYKVDGKKGGLHDLKPVRCDWDQSLRDLKFERPVELTLGAVTFKGTRKGDYQVQYTLARGGTVLWEGCSITPKSFKGWVSPSGDTYVVVEIFDKAPMEEGTYPDYSYLTLRLPEKGNKPDVEEIWVDAPTYDVSTPMMMQSGSECVLQLRGVLNGEKKDNKKRVANYPLKAWPLSQSDGSLNTTQEPEDRRAPGFCYE